MEWEKVKGQSGTWMSKNGAWVVTRCIVPGLKYVVSKRNPDDGECEPVEWYTTSQQAKRAAERHQQQVKPAPVRTYSIDNRIFMMVRKARERAGLVANECGPFSEEYKEAHARFCALWDVIEEFGLVHDWLIYDGKNPAEYGY